MSEHDPKKAPDERPRPQYGELAPPGWVWKPPQVPIFHVMEATITENDPDSPLRDRLADAVLADQSAGGIEQQRLGRRGALVDAEDVAGGVGHGVGLRYSRGAAEECSPRREPWVQSRWDRDPNALSPGGAKEHAARGCSVAPPGLCHVTLREPTADAVGYILPPLRG